MAKGSAEHWDKHLQAVGSVFALSDLSDLSDLSVGESRSRVQ